MKRINWLGLIVALGIVASWTAAACGEWVRLPVVRQTQRAGMMGRIEARLPDQSIMQGEDAVGRGHYGAHGVNSYARNKFGAGTNQSNAAYWPTGWC